MDKLYYMGHEVKLIRTYYASNGRLAIWMCGKSDHDYHDRYEPLCVITVNIDDGIEMPENMAYIDNNNMPDIIEWLEQNNVANARFTGEYGRSGYCRYSIYEFDLTQLAEDIL